MFLQSLLVSGNLIQTFGHLKAVFETFVHISSPFEHGQFRIYYVTPEHRSNVNHKPIRQTVGTYVISPKGMGSGNHEQPPYNNQRGQRKGKMMLVMWPQAKSLL